MEKVTLKASMREKKGKIACKHMRKEGMVPGVVYKKGVVGSSIFVDSKQLWKSLNTESGEHAVITLEISDQGKSKTKTVIPKEVQHDPMSDRIIHIDFQEISLTEVIKVSVPIVLKGEAEGVTEGGVLNQVLWEIEVECKAMSIPENITINIETMKIGDAIHVSDLEIPEGIKVIDDAEQLVVGVNPPHAEEEIETEGAEESTEEPEVVKKGKKEEDEEEGEEEGE